jgi:hypothetical protein
MCNAARLGRRGDRSTAVHVCLRELVCLKQLHFVQMDEGAHSTLSQVYKPDREIRR